jgi:two-component system sensor histidine kinase MtrB
MQARRDDMPERRRPPSICWSPTSRVSRAWWKTCSRSRRFDAGAIRLNLDDLLVAEFVRHAVAVSSHARTHRSPCHERAERIVIIGDRATPGPRASPTSSTTPGCTAAVTRHVAMTEAGGRAEPAWVHAWIAVEDHGLPGVPIEERDLVFERFARGAVAGRRSTSDGAGLGLALVDEHIRMHGGRVWVEERLDGEPGARFVLELPAEELT